MLICTPMIIISLVALPQTPIYAPFFVFSAGSFTTVPWESRAEITDVGHKRLSLPQYSKLKLFSTNCFCDE